jgi:iron complex transport system ATP-binding protein
MSALLEVRDLTHYYEAGHIIFEHVNFTVNPGEVFTLLGPNGAGKSTLLNCLDNLLAPRSGEVLVEGEPIDQIAPRDLATKIAYVPQTINVTYGYSVREYLVMGAAPRLGMFATPGREEYERVDEAIEQLNLQKLAGRTISRLSGGERQRVAIARAIVQNPKIILFDEPTSALDYGNQIRVMRTIKRLSEQNYAVVMTTHNPDQPILLGGEVGMLDRDGSMVVGDTETAITSEKLSDLYQTELHLVYVDEVDRIACVSGKL